MPKQVWTPIVKAIEFNDANEEVSVTVAEGGAHTTFSLKGKVGYVQFSDDEPLLRLCEAVDAPPAIPATPEVLLALDELIAWAQFGIDESFIVGPAREKLLRHVGTVQAAIGELGATGMDEGR